MRKRALKHANRFLRGVVVMGGVVIALGLIVLGVRHPIAAAVFFLLCLTYFLGASTERSKGCKNDMDN